MPTSRSRFKPLRFDFYILSETLGPFFGGMLFFLFVFLMLQGLRLAEFFIVHGVSLGMLCKLTALLMLSFIPTALPIAFLIGVLASFGRLSADSELVAMKACGFSLHRTLVPVLALGCMIVTLSLFLNMEWVPWGERQFKTLLIKVGNTKVVNSIKEGTFTSGFFDLLVFSDKIDAKNNRLKHVFIYDEREPKNPLTVIAKEGEIAAVKNQKFSAAAMLRLFDGTIHRNESQEGNYHKINFNEYQLFLKIQEGEEGTAMKPHTILYRDLVERIRKTDLSTQDGREFRGEYWRRIAIAITPLIFAFLGVGFGTVRTRAVRASAALITIVILVIYWVTQTVGSMALIKGVIPPFWAMQLPNIILLGMAAYAYNKATW